MTAKQKERVIHNFREAQRWIRSRKLRRLVVLPNGSQALLTYKEWKETVARIQKEYSNGGES